jgi:hypothetical protein
MSEKISSASDSEFREEIGKNIPGKAASIANWAGVIAGYKLGKHLAKRDKQRRRAR